MATERKARMLEASKRHGVSVMIPLARPCLGYASLIADPKEWLAAEWDARISEASKRHEVSVVVPLA